MDSCRDCKFYNINPHDLKVGACRKVPPRAFLVQVVTPQGTVPNTISAWAPVKAEDWCGEFFPKGVLASAAN